MATLHLFRGHPGSGKTTAAYRMFPGIFHVENDMYVMRDNKYEWSKDTVKDSIDWCISMVRNALEHGFDVVVANTFTKRRYIEAYKKIAEEYGANFDVHRCVGNFQNAHGLNSKMVDSFIKAMEDWPGEHLVNPTI